MIAPPASSRPVYIAPSTPPGHHWPGPSQWMAGDLHFYVRWLGPSNPRHAGAQIMTHLVPLFRRADYEIVERAPDRLVLRRERPAFIRGPSQQPEITIVMTDGGDHSVTEVYGVAPQTIREALARLAG